MIIHNDVSTPAVAAVQPVNHPLLKIALAAMPGATRTETLTEKQKIL
jgi:hypothetical protein